MIERTTVRLPADLMERARRKAARDGSTLTALIEEGLREVVNAAPRPAPEQRVLPRISRADGGLMPGIDLDRLSSIQDLEDSDEAARLKRLG